MKYPSFKFALVLIAALPFMQSCGDYSQTTGWEYNNSKNGGFEVRPYIEQETGPGLVLIEGGTFVMGRTEQDVMFNWDNIPRRVTVNSFYMDQTEVRNVDWLEYLYWLGRVYGQDFRQIYQKALPDTNVWRSQLAYNEPYAELYLRHPAYQHYPVVGVSWLQARSYCAWRTDRVNEMIMIREGILSMDPDQLNETNFNSSSYLAGQYVGLVKQDLVDIAPNGTSRIVRVEDGIMLPKYRLPTEAEWEFAALGLIGNTIYERVVERRIYPWNGHVTRTDGRKDYGMFVANFQRANGDYMGTAGALNDAATIPAPVFSYWPNDYGLYNMAGNVSEWVADVYRRLTPEDMEQMNPFRGNQFDQLVYNNEGVVSDKLDYVTYDYQGLYDKILEFEKAGEATTSQPEKDLLARIKVYGEEALKAHVNRDEEEASAQIDAMIDEISNAEDYISIGGNLQKIIADYITGMPGELRKRPVRLEENLTRRNYRVSDYRDYLDGDWASSVSTDYSAAPQRSMYDFGNTTMINNRARVFKGGSWRDRAYWLSPGTKRYLDEAQSTDYIGFRCAMTRVGSPIGNNN
jgi:gliding motility-associated lipoprotein GldJ